MTKPDWDALTLRELELIALALEFAALNRSQLEEELEVELAVRELMRLQDKFESYGPLDTVRQGKPDRLGE